MSAPPLVSGMAVAAAGCSPSIPNGSHIALCIAHYSYSPTRVAHAADGVPPPAATPIRRGVRRTPAATPIRRGVRRTPTATPIRRGVRRTPAASRTSSPGRLSQCDM
ncbi:MAG: hypothetical protein OJF49_002388 [Ktedonobacterales bacterium]|nr:MAG: hypothetical protein OJF49_002388 [Ktedonobacterales bacterium]